MIVYRQKWNIKLFYLFIELINQISFFKKGNPEDDRAILVTSIHVSYKLMDPKIQEVIQFLRIKILNHGIKKKKKEGIGKANIEMESKKISISEANLSTKYIVLKYYD